MDGNPPGMMTGVVPVPVPAPKVPSHRASHQRAHRGVGMLMTTMTGKDGADGMTTTTMIGKAGKAGEVVDMTRKRKNAVGAGVSMVADYFCFICGLH